MEEYKHPTYGTGEIISRNGNIIAVKFPNPPGMTGKGVIPTLLIDTSTLINEESKDA